VDHSRKPARAFTLVELLAVIAILAMLVAMLLPGLSAARERARVVKAHGELYGIGTALHSYHTENDAYPPVHASCNTDLWQHYCQLPPELSHAGYLPVSREAGLEARIEDEFHPGFTYKYTAPGDMVVNYTLMKLGSYVWVPDAFPYDDPAHPDLWETTDGKLYNDPDTCPVKWVVYSVGPEPESDKSWSPRAPIARNTWYSRIGDTGVIARIMTFNGVITSGP